MAGDTGLGHTDESCVVRIVGVAELIIGTSDHSAEVESQETEIYHDGVLDARSTDRGALERSGRRCRTSS